MSTIFNSVLTTSENLTVGLALLCMGAALVLGGIVAFVYSRQNMCTKGYLTTLVILPVIVQAVIMMVNGNLGVGVAVAGTFTLVRFRSAPGTAKELATVFMDVAIGLACGMGQIAFAGLFTVLICIVMMIMEFLPFESAVGMEKFLKITVPENLEFEGLFDDVLKEYATEYKLESVKTVDMGSLYELKYRIREKQGISEKKMMDTIRCRNGNLNVRCGYADEFHIY